MLDRLMQVSIYTVKVLPRCGSNWIGVFTHHPEVEDVRCAIEADILQLEDDNYQSNLEMLQFVSVMKIGTQNVEIAGTHIGDVSLATKKGWGINPDYVRIVFEDNPPADMPFPVDTIDPFEGFILSES